MELKKQLIEIVELGLIHTLFQPIISLRDASVLGHEALSRGPQHTPFHSPETLFDQAIRHGMLWPLELVCRTKSLEALSNSKIKTKLFLNVNPNIIHDAKFKSGFTKSYLRKFSIQPDSIIFEITEKGAIHDIADFKKTVQNYKEQNYQIAIDDAGAGLSGLNRISDIHPHFIKLDMNLIRHVDQDVTKQALVRSMVEFTTLSDTHLIAEGIETKEELLKLIEMGVHYGQGYFIQKPSPAIVPIDIEVQEIIKQANMKKNRLVGSPISDIFIGNISHPIQTLSPAMRIEQVHRMMVQDLTVPGYCITENTTVIGVITRNHLFSTLSGQYAFSLYGNKEISTIMSKEFLHVKYDDPIAKVARLAMQRVPDQLYDFVTVTRDGKYAGIVTVKDLLEKTIQIEVNTAKQLNPISGLPGNILIEKQLDEHLHSGQPFTLLYIDIDNFKPYNDVYGFEKGDAVIKLLANILKETLPKNEFVGHIGGDDFVAILSHHPIHDLCKSIISEFDRSTSHFYTSHDLEQGFIIAKNRHGIEETYPLLSISIAGIINHRRSNIFELAKQASEIKKKCKQVSGSAYLIVNAI